MTPEATALTPETEPRSKWGAFSHTAFLVIWLATTGSLTGIAMSDTASAWLMTNLSPDPLAVSMVQVASSLPMFLFTLPAGAIADLVAARRFLIFVESFITLLILAFATMVSFGAESGNLLLTTIFLLSASWSIAAPAWMAITPILVPRRDLDDATAANSAGYNISRAIGPPIAGFLISRFGVALPYWLFVVSNCLTLAALVWWRAPETAPVNLPAERFMGAMRAGVRYTLFNPHLRATMARTLAVYPFAAAYTALLPLVARSQMTQGPELYGLLIGAISVGAVGGTFALRRLKAALGPDGVVALGTIGIVAALILFGSARDPAMALAAALVAGASWTVVLATLYVSAQIALPDWVRGRGLAVFLTLIFGSVTLGSATWGWLAAHTGLSTAHYVAAACALIAIPLTWRWKLQSAEGVDLTPAMHWQPPALLRQPDDDSGPVLVTVRYRIAGEDPKPFLSAIEEIGLQRRRDGAFAWGVFEDVGEKGLFLETFLIESWLEARYLPGRVTNDDRLREDRLQALLREPPQVALLIATAARRHARRHPVVSRFAI